MQDPEHRLADWLAESRRRSVRLMWSDGTRFRVIVEDERGEKRSGDEEELGDAIVAAIGKENREG